MKRKDAFTKAQWKQETYRVCKECTTQKREAGTPYRCTQCGLWHAICHFASKHQNPRWSMYRVCLSCDAVKPCFLCHKKRTKEYFSVAAWKASEPKRRLCLQCQTKTRGSWTCMACQQRKPQRQFSIFISKRPSGKDGTQICNECRAVIVRDAIRKRAATTSIGRLEPLRKNSAGHKFYARHGKPLPRPGRHAGCSLPRVPYHSAAVMPRCRPCHRHAQKRRQWRILRNYRGQKLYAIPTQCSPQCLFTSTHAHSAMQRCVPQCGQAG